MKSLAELDHYELLEVAPDADPAEIERAFRMAQATWSEDSVAIHSVFENGEGEALRERIETAYRVLSNQETRRAYDDALASGDPARTPVSLGLLPEEARIPDAGLEGFEDVDAREDDAAWDGARLRRVRLLHGKDLDEAARVTKVKRSYLRALEEEQFEALPARVYTRGFVAAYARFLDLDPGRVAVGYMEHFDAACGAPRRPRLLGRR